MWTLRGGGEKAVDELHEDGERFTIVDAGAGQVAFHSKRNNRFVKMDKDSINGTGWGGCGCRDVDSLPHSWAGERFTVKLLKLA